MAERTDALRSMAPQAASTRLLYLSVSPLSHAGVCHSAGHPDQGETAMEAMRLPVGSAGSNSNPSGSPGWTGSGPTVSGSPTVSFGMAPAPEIQSNQFHAIDTSLKVSCQKIAGCCAK